MAEAGEVFWRIFTMQKGMVSGFGVLTLTGGVARILLLASLPFIFRKQNDEKKRYYRNASLIILIIVGMILKVNWISLNYMDLICRISLKQRFN